MKACEQPAASSQAAWGFDSLSKRRAGQPEQRLFLPVIKLATSFALTCSLPTL